MSGRDCIAVATTGSGKTLGYVLPMIRHVNDQIVRGIDEKAGHGPIGLVIAPTRELVQQISREVRLFGKPLELRCTAAYGGSQVKDQINELKRGVEVVVCTPGRMIDILVTSNGAITNLRRVTMLVIDEADRMFDMGFEPQINRIIAQIRPDRQTVLFSATFPRQVELLARTVLHEPVEIQVGGRSTVSQTIKQIVEIRNSEDERFARLLELLGEFQDAGKVLIFVNSQEKCSTLFQQLLNYGYPNQPLHGDMQQTDRESTISDFKAGVCSMLVATSVAARGLDVRDLVLVINYDTPNHLEEYVHRCGRTGRAGAAGTAITFIAHEDEQYAPDLVKAMKDSKAVVPKDIQRMADRFNEKRKRGLVKGHGSGFGGSGFRFDFHEDDAHNAIKKRHAIEFKPADEAADGAAKEAARESMQAAEAETVPTGAGAAKYGTTIDAPEVAHISEDRRKEAQRIALAAAQRLAAMSRTTETLAGGIRRVVPTVPQPRDGGETQAALVLAAQEAASKIAGNLGWRQDAAARARMQAMQSQAARQAGVQAQAATEYYETDLVINDFPQAARYHVTHRETIANIAERTGAAIIIKGQYYAPGQYIPPDDSKLYLVIEGPTHGVVQQAKNLIKSMIEEKTEKSMRREAGAMGRFNIA